MFLKGYHWGNVAQDKENVMEKRTYSISIIAQQHVSNVPFRFTMDDGWCSIGGIVFADGEVNACNSYKGDKGWIKKTIPSAHLQMALNQYVPTHLVDGAKFDIVITKSENGITWSIENEQKVNRVAAPSNTNTKADVDTMKANILKMLGSKSN